MKRCIFVGQAMPRKKSSAHDWPSLNKWLYSIGLTDRQITTNFVFSALIDYFPGSTNGTHNIPTEEQIQKNRNVLRSTINKFDPEVTVPIGRLSISYCLKQKVRPLNEDVGLIYHKDPYGLLGKETIIIPLPHPSGASTWCNSPSNKKLLSKSLEILRSSVS